MPRVGLVGARTVRQGLGPWVARDLVAAGLEVPCFLGTRPETIAEAAAQLRERSGVEARGYTELEPMLERERLDALAILSPPETHERFLAEAAAAGLHVLCEKPLLWGGPGLAERARERIEAFRARGLLLAENCQWPFTLEAFGRLHPGWTPRAPERFEMWLSPRSAGLRRIGDCMSHPLSLLQALTPGVEGCVEKTTLSSDGSGLRTEITFEYVAGPARVATSVTLLSGSSQPRAAGFAIDGFRAERWIQMPGYTMEFVEGRRSVKLPDPLTARLAAFAEELRRACRGGPVPDPAPLAARMAGLSALVAAWRQMLDESPRLSE